MDTKTSYNSMLPFNAVHIMFAEFPIILTREVSEGSVNINSRTSACHTHLFFFLCILLNGI